MSAVSHFDARHAIADARVHAALATTRLADDVRTLAGLGDALLDEAEEAVRHKTVACNENLHYSIDLENARAEIARLQARVDQLEAAERDREVTS
jgi:hypothetical protein